MIRLRPSLRSCACPLRSGRLPQCPAPPRPPPAPFPQLPRQSLRSARRHQSTAAAAIASEAPSSSQASAIGLYNINGRTFAMDTYSNAPPTILSKISRGLLNVPSHPLAILRQTIEDHFAGFRHIVHPDPVVTVFQNFDELGFPADHPGRAVTDSYYINQEYMLRAHTSAHEVETYSTGMNKWLLSADVYRRDEIDASHYPVFHQMEGTSIWPTTELHTLAAENERLAAELASCPLIIEDPTQISATNPYQPGHDPEHAKQITQHLKHSLNSLIFKLFGRASLQGGEPLRVRWIEAFFPFTTPSYEVEVWWGGEWLELLGCGVVMQKTLDLSGWAFGLGLERIAMVLFNIPDIRLFWSEDPRFVSQFSTGIESTFKPYSKYPPCYKDMSFWLPSASLTVPQGSHAGGAEDAQHANVETAGVGGKVFHENDYCEIVREVAGDLVETVTLIDDFKHPKSGRQSKCYRLNYRSMDRSLSNEEVNALQDQVQSRVVAEMGIEMR